DVEEGPTAAVAAQLSGRGESREEIALEGRGAVRQPAHDLVGQEVDARVDPSRPGDSLLAKRRDATVLGDVDATVASGVGHMRQHDRRTAPREVLERVERHAAVRVAVEYESARPRKPDRAARSER